MTSKKSPSAPALDIDDKGRIRFGGSVNFRSQKYAITGVNSSPIDTHLFAIKTHCLDVFNCRNTESNESYSAGSTFFIKASEKPRCFLEKLALEIFALHTKRCSFDPAKSGAEWWTQVIHPDDEIGFHWDRDYGLEDCGVHVHPHLGTVTYLSSTGGSTIITGHEGTKYSHENPAASENTAVGRSLVVSKPFVGKHITFDGLFLHGAPSDFKNEDSDDDKSSADDNSRNGSQTATISNLDKMRVTFLVNVWLNHIPMDSESLPKSTLKKFKGLSDVNNASFSFKHFPDDSLRQVTLGSGSGNTGTGISTSSSKSGGSAKEGKGIEDSVEESIVKCTRSFKNYGQKYDIEIAVPKDIESMMEGDGNDMLHINYHGGIQSTLTVNYDVNSSSGTDDDDDDDDDDDSSDDSNGSNDEDSNNGDDDDDDDSDDDDDDGSGGGNEDEKDNNFGHANKRHKKSS